MYPGSENIYWLFSASAQSIAAFAAFLITGFALVNALMNSIEEKDDSLIEIHEEIKSNYYTRIKWLAGITSLAVILSLLAIFLNPYCFQYKATLFVFTATLNVVSIVAGVGIVLAYIDPSKYRKAAERLIEEEEKELETTGQEVEQQEFYNEFVTLERNIRSFLRKKDLYEPSVGGPKMSFSFRKMVNALREDGYIGKGLYDELLDINKYRNLVFHGHKEKVDRKMVNKVRDVAERTDNILDFRT